MHLYGHHYVRKGSNESRKSCDPRILEYPIGTERHQSSFKIIEQPRVDILPRLLPSFKALEENISLY